jgi:hypothetical protein
MARQDLQRRFPLGQKGFPIRLPQIYCLFHFRRPLKGRQVIKRQKNVYPSPCARSSQTERNSHHPTRHPFARSKPWPLKQERTETSSPSSETRLARHPFLLFLPPCKGNRGLMMSSRFLWFM